MLLITFFLVLGLVRFMLDIVVLLLWGGLCMGIGLSFVFLLLMFWGSRD